MKTQHQHRPRVARTGRVTLMVRSLNIGGAERQVVLLAKAMHAAGWQVQVVVWYEEGSFIGDLERSGVPFTFVGKRGRWDVFGFVVRLVRILRAYRPSVLYAFSVVPSLVATVLKPFFHKSAIVWGVRASNMDYTKYGRLAVISFKASCILARFADRIIANSVAGYDFHIENGYPQERMVVVPNGIDTERYKFDPDARLRQRREWSVGDETLVGIVGRVDPMKGHDIFLQAVAILNDRGTTLRFVCVGGGPPGYENDLKKRTHNLGIADIVSWVGPMTAMSDVYSALDVMCVPSVYGEGFSNTLGEAMACGVPCVVTNVGDSARIVEDIGVVIPPGDPESLADGIQTITSGLSAGLRTLCAARIAEQYSVNSLLKNTEAALAGVGSVDG